MSGIRCVVWDIGAVLVRWEPRVVYRQMGHSDHEIDAIYAETKLLEANHRRLDAGESFDEVINELAVAFPHHETFLRAFYDRWEDMLEGAVEENVRLLGDLKSVGVPVHAISNFNHKTFERCCELFPFLNSFDHAIVSGRIGLVKPEREIFDHWQQETGTAPAHAVFIDDSAANIATADALGFHTVHFTEGKTDVRARLTELGLPVGGAQ